MNTKHPHWLEYIAHYTRKPTVHPKTTVADVEAATPLAVVEKPSFARIRLADKVRYKDGKRTVTPQWSGKAYPVVGYRNEFTLLDTGHGIIGRLHKNVMHETEYIGNVTAKAAA